MFNWIGRKLKSWFGFGRPQLEPVWATPSAPGVSDACSFDTSKTPERKKPVAVPEIKVNYVNQERDPGHGQTPDALKQQLVRFQSRQKQLQEERLSRFTHDCQLQLERHLERHAARIEARVAHRLDQLCRDIPMTAAGSMDVISNRIATTVQALVEVSTATLQKQLSDAVAANIQRACLRPAIDQLLALHDRIDDERQFLAASFRRDVDLATHVEARRLQAQHDAAARSFATEILMILRGLGVEPLEPSGPDLDPHMQRVVGVEPNSRAELDGRIARIARRGFRWNGALLRPEQVIVYKKGD